MRQFSLDANLSHARPDARHRLPVVRVQRLLNLAKLESAAASRISGKRADIASGASEPDKRLLRHESICQFLYIRATRRRLRPWRSASLVASNATPAASTTEASNFRYSSAIQSCKSFCLNRLEMVEAAGVEPASENTSSQSTTCVSPFDCRGRLRTEPSAPSASPDKSHPRASRRNAGTSLLNDGQSQATGLLKLTAHWLLSSESVVCVRSYVVFPQDLRGRGPRHAFRDPAPPSKPNRPRE